MLSLEETQVHSLLMHKRVGQRASVFFGCSTGLRFFDHCVLTFGKRLHQVHREVILGCLKSKGNAIDKKQGLGIISTKLAY